MYLVHSNYNIEEFKTWADTQQHIKTCSGPRTTKKFSHIKAAKDWIFQQKKWNVDFKDKPNTAFTAFVDGSIKEGYPLYGCAIYDNKHELVTTNAGLVMEDVDSRQISGELGAALVALDWAVCNKQPIHIVYDYHGIVAWASGAWKMKTGFIETYHREMQKYSEYITGMHWVKGHSGNNTFLARGNAMADRLAGRALIGRQ